MKIYQLIQSIESVSSGPSYSVTMLSQALSIDNNVEIVSFGEKAGVNVTGVKFNYISYRAHIFSTISTRYKRILSNIYTEQNSILHGHAVWRLINLASLYRRSGSSTKIVWSPRGSFSEWSMNHHRFRKLPFWLMLQKPAMERVDCFHATAESEYNDIRRLGFTQPIAIIPNGISEPKIYNHNKQKIIVFLSRIHKKKGLELLINSWGNVANQHDDWCLKIVGPINDNYSRQLKDKTEKKSIPRLEFMGELIGDDKSAILANAGIFVLPTYSENFGIVIAEALAHELPVITTSETPWSELENENIGWIIDPDENQLTDALNKSLSIDFDKLVEMGVNGKRWVLNNYSWDVIAEDMSSTYGWLLGKNKKPDCVHLD